MTDILCSHCNKTFFRGAGEHAKALRKGKTKHFCSRDCANSARAVGDTTIDLICATCRGPFKRVLADHRRNADRGLRQAFCSPACSDIGRTLAPIEIIEQSTFKIERRSFESGSTLAERIEFYAKRMPNGCLEWQGSYTALDNRPILKVGIKNELVARLVWVQHNGPIPEGLITRHVVCRNRRCIDIKHLDIGTHLDNAIDRERDGMTSRGETHGGAKLTKKEVQEILASKSESLAALSRQYGVGKSQIRRIRLGLSRERG